MSKILLFILFFAPLIALGQGTVYQPLVGIPGVDNPAENFGNYLNQLYFLSISVAALIAVVKIIIAGVKWMMTDLISGKSEAATEIRTSLLGLLLIVSAVLILETINPQLTNFNVLRYATPVRQIPPPQQQQTIAPGAGAALVPSVTPGQPSELVIFPQQGATALEPSAYENRCDSTKPIEYDVCTSIPNGSCQPNPPPRTTSTPPPNPGGGAGPREVVIQVRCTPR